MIYIDNLIKTVGTRTLFTLDKLTVDENDKIGLIGDNGVGKTTFLKILSGLDFDYSGNVEVKTKINFLLNDSKSKIEDKKNYSPG
ncbi:MAG: ATP-binding cassette domain-containing protein [Treponemataceae bacterium]